MVDWDEHLYPHQQEAIINKKDKSKCIVNMWCGTGKTRTFTISLFQDFQDINVIVFPSLGLINQYNNDYFLNQNKIFKEHFDKFQCLAFCSDDDTKLKLKASTIKYSTSEKTCKSFMKKKDKKIILVTYHSFEKFINICFDNEFQINRLIFDEAHHVVGEKIQEIVINNERLDNIVDKTEYYTATPVNKNEITMYDREEPENSDCGELAYEYLYHKAVEDKVCKAFTTNIGLYCIKPEYKNKYQPIFELIIRACLSGEYDYWNVLTYHTYVNEKDSTNGLSYVNDFASNENQRLFKSLFTTIQNEEFTDTKSLYHLDNVLLKGVSCETKNREKIIEEFDKKVPGRIYILASCGILNEGIDTKWANMGVPINPSKSIVKETQRIGRLVRIPENNMPNAVILIPCLIDIEKYKDLNNLEEQDKMIRQELSETGNFNTALNVISAFKYQYDPELYEKCLRYPNMYAPQEIKDNLSKYGLIVEESRGDLVDNLKYICEKEDIPFEIELNNNMSDDELLSLVSEELEKSIEIYTQDYDEPVKFINRECVDDEPIRLFYSDDDKNYSPIMKKEKNMKIKRKDIKSPKKRKAIFNIHTHPDLDVLWNIKDVKLNKHFGQGVLDVNIDWNVKTWNINYELLKTYMTKEKQCPVRSYITDCGVTIGNWVGTQRQYKRNNILDKPKINKLESLTGWLWELDLDECWNINYELLKTYMTKEKQCPVRSYITDCGVKIGSWINRQRTNKKKNKLDKTKINKLESLAGWFWELDLDEGWNINYELLKTYMTKEKQCPTLSYITDCGVKIGSWINTQRQYKKKNNLDKTKINKLESLEGWFWDLDEGWNINYELLKTYITKEKQCPVRSYITDCGVKIGRWINKQRQNKKKNILDKMKINKLESLEGWLWGLDLDEGWNINYELLKTYMTKEKQCPAQSYITDCGVKIGAWVSKQRHSKKKNNLDKMKINKLESLEGWVWESKKTTTKKDMSKPIIQSKKEPSTKSTKPPPKSELSELHKKYKTMSSQNLNKQFNDNKEEWEKYHEISKQNEQSFPEEDIPRNRIIKKLETFGGKRKKEVVDLGCGYGEISQYFKDNNRFVFQNFDHVAINDTIISKDIKNTELDDTSVDIVIMCLSMWGSNCKDYLKEAYRILDIGGTLYIVEPYKRWNDNEENKNRLVELLKENNFVIAEQIDEKFMYIECRK